jgi:hypothetical protein
MGWFGSLRGSGFLRWPVAVIIKIWAVLVDDWMMVREVTDGDGGREGAESRISKVRYIFS